jgi:hypothetical protein
MYNFYVSSIFAFEFSRPIWRIKMKFDYALMFEIIDFFSGTLTADELQIQKIKETDSTDLNSIKKMIDESKSQIDSYVYSQEKEVPFLIRYFGIPQIGEYETNICAVAKVTNNGTTYLFSNNYDFLKLYENEYSKIVRLS